MIPSVRKKTDDYPVYSIHFDDNASIIDTVMFQKGHTTEEEKTEKCMHGTDKWNCDDISTLEYSTLVSNQWATSTKSSILSF